MKPVKTLDLIVIGAEWGHGRRSGWLSNLHLAALGLDGEPVMVGKTFKGLTDELLTWQTSELLAAGDGPPRHHVFPFGRNWSSRSPSTGCRCPPAIAAVSRCASPASAATGRIRIRADADTIETVRAMLP